MMWRTLLFLCAARYVVHETPTLSPDFTSVLENNSVTLTCSSHAHTKMSTWRLSNRNGLQLALIFMEEGICTVTGVLSNTTYFETKCYSNATFEVKIKRVNRTYHGQEWYCICNYTESNKALINVIVPLKYIHIEPMSEEIMAVEKMKTTLTCQTSEGHPPANITWWVQQSTGSSRINLEDDKNISIFKTITDRNLTVVNSSIDLEPKRDDNNTLIFCEASNGTSPAKSKTVRMYVQYPPSKPTFVLNGNKVNDSINFISGENDSLHCYSESYPSATYVWTSSTISNYEGKYLNLTSLTQSDTWQCRVTNTMTLPNETTTFGNSSSNITINLLYPSKIQTFFVMGENASEIYKVNENETLVFNCSVDSYPESEIVILSKNKELKRDASTNLLSYAHKFTSCLDEGAYTCRAKNKFNSKPSSKELKVIVRCTPLLAPEFDLKNSIASPNNVKITFHFKAIAYPKPTFHWFKLNGSYKIDLKNESRLEINTNDNYSNLTIRRVIEEDYGEYKLRIQNEIGYFEQLYFLNVQDSRSLTEKPIRYWVFVIFTCGGVILTLIVFIVIFIFKKRLMKQHPSNTVQYQNVPFPEANIRYLNVPSSAQRPLNINRQVHTRKAEAPDSQMQCKRNSQSREDFEEQFSEPTEYSNALDIIDSLEEIKVSELYDYVKDLTDDSINAEFQKIPTGFELSCSFAQKPENIGLNRYKSILPYDHTRVCINDECNVFINASYIDGYQRSKAYIACLGPTAATHDNFRTFWEMVWHEKTELIVMLTNLNEPSGLKCEKYWPDEKQDDVYGDILVTCLKIEKFAEFTLRSFEISKTSNSDNVYQRCLHLHYTEWPDKKIPEDVASILEFRQKVQDIRATLNGPVIVHCSAGIGRTGVFIALDSLIMEGKHKDSVNIVACLKNMRRQRMKMVQTSKQYKFIYQALAYALTFNWDPVSIESLTSHIGVSAERHFDRQYMELEVPLGMEEKEQTDTREKNRRRKGKNRQGADIPGDRNRVYLYLDRTFEESDYINAVYINSYTRKDHFIIAQSPLPGTESDFLTMIFQEKCFWVVSMEDLYKDGMEIGKYILKEQPLNIGRFTVSCNINDIKPHYTVRKVTITDKDKSTSEREFYHFNYKNWSDENDTPESAEDFLDFVKDIQEYAGLGDDGSRVLVHCKRANERSGLFCAIAIIMEKLLLDEEVSVLNTLRHLRTRRPSAITSKEQLKFCYEVAAVFAKMQHKGMYINIL